QNNHAHNAWKDSVSGGSLAIDTHEQVGLTEFCEDAEVGDALNRSHDFGHTIRRRFEVLQIASEQLDRVLALHTRHCFFHVILNGLREVVIDSGNLAQFGLDLANQLRLIHAGPPIFARFKIHEKLTIEIAGRIRAVLGPSELADDIRDFGIFFKGKTHLIGQLTRIGEIDGIANQLADHKYSLLELMHNIDT